MRSLDPFNLRAALKRIRVKRGTTAGAGRILFTRAPLSPEAVLLMRALLVLALFALVFCIFLLDRGGLRDHSDGDVSVSDVIYFTMVTVTTVGYGDIVPITERARLIDALLVTPVRVFVWFIFIGTAYQFVIQRVIEDWRMSRLQRRLSNHVVICGFGNNGRSAAAEMMAKGIASEDIVVIERDESRAQAAIERNLVLLRGDATREDMLRVAAVERARGVIVTVGRDDTALMIVVSTRALGGSARIVASVYESENVKLLRNAGADTVIKPWTFGGYLLADAITQQYTVDILQDALSSGGTLNLIERAPKREEIGEGARTLRYSLVLGVVRSGLRIMFWQEADLRIQESDRLIVLDARAREA